MRQVKDYAMALTTSSRREQLVQFIHNRLRRFSAVKNAWIEYVDQVFHVNVIVDTDDLAAEQQVRELYGPLLDAFPDLDIDLYVANERRLGKNAWESMIPPKARRIDV
jgi:hypothetical protein